MRRTSRCRAQVPPQAPPRRRRAPMRRLPPDGRGLISSAGRRTSRPEPRWAPASARRRTACGSERSRRRALPVATAPPAASELALRRRHLAAAATATTTVRSVRLPPPPNFEGPARRCTCSRSCRLRPARSSPRCSRRASSTTDAEACRDRGGREQAGVPPPSRMRRSCSQRAGPGRQRFLAVATWKT